jgi:hypothetical protein
VASIAMNSMKVTVALCISFLMCVSFVGCGDGTSQEPNSESGGTSLNEESDQSSEGVNEREKAEEYAKIGIGGVFSDYLAKAEEAESTSAFMPEYSVNIEDKEVFLEVTANFPVLVSREAWDKAVSEGTNPPAEYNEFFGRFRDMLQEQMQGFLQYVLQEGVLTEDWSGEFEVVLVVKNSDGMILSEYR